MSSNISRGRTSRNRQTANGCDTDAPNALSIKRSSSFVRPKIRSSVPNSPKTTFISKRPSEPGNVGQRIDLYTNHCQIKLSNRTNETILYQFNIDVQLLTSDGSWHSCNKYTFLAILKIIIKQERFPLVWYDDIKCLFSIEDLKTNYENEYQCEIHDEVTLKTEKYRFLIFNLIKTYDLKSIFDFIQKMKPVQSYDPVRILDILFKQTQIFNMITIANQSYPKPQQLKDIGGGRGMASGFYQGIVLGEGGPTLNINNKCCCFYQNYNLVEFLSSYLNHDIRIHGIPSEDQPLLGQNILESLWFILPDTDKIHRYRFKSFWPRANEHELPDVELYNPDNNQEYILPMEYIIVDQGKVSVEAFTTEQDGEVKQIIVVPPSECYAMIKRFIIERQLDQDPYLKTLGITVAVDGMLMLPARILPPSSIKYKSSRAGQDGDVIEQVAIGRWYLNNCFYNAREIRTWAVVLVSQSKPDDRQILSARGFVHKLRKAMSKCAIQFNSSPIEKFHVPSPQTILAGINELKIQGCEFIIYILNQVGNDIYDVIENIETDTVTQCISFDRLMSISDSSDMDMYIQNDLVKELSAKLVGVNQFVSLMRALTATPSPSDAFMFFGIDCTHIECSDERPSIVAIAASKDSTSTQYTTRVVEEFPSTGKIALDIIEDLHIYVDYLLRVFSNYNSRLPNKLVFYQVGLHNPSFQNVLNQEVQAIQRACQELYGHNPLPQICFVLVKNYHNTRFFILDKQSNRANNIQQGTVVDTDIVSPNGFYFYLNSHATIKGTSRPVLYQVLYDEIGFTADEIQLLTNFLCNSPFKSINVPAPIESASLCVKYHKIRKTEVFNNEKLNDQPDHRQQAIKRESWKDKLSFSKKKH